MKILVVGGTGMIGGHAALWLRSRGYSVAVAARKPPPATTAMGELEFLPCDYVEGGLPDSALARFEALVFAAGHDVRHMPRGFDESTHWDKVNSEAVPRLFAAARAAGIRHAINVGTFYPQAAPHLVGKHAYVRSRKLADEGVRALATPGFRVMSVNPPFVTGTVPGLTVPMFEAYTRYAEGAYAPMPDFAPAGGVNFISAQSLSEAIQGALERGQSGAAYLVGDENLGFQEYFGRFFRAVGKTAPLPVLDQEHPMMPDSALYFGRGNTLYYEPDAAEAALLGYRRNDVGRAIHEIVAQYRTSGAGR